MSLIHSLIIRSMLIPSNVFFAPLNPGYSENGRIQRGYCDFFVNHAGRETGICYVGNVSLQKEGRSNEGTAVLSSNPDAKWETLAERISLAGSLPGIQLAYNPSQHIMQKAFTTNEKSEAIDSYQKYYNSFDNEKQIIAQFVSAAQRAYSLGFSVIQIHAAHGYLLSLLLSRSISGSTDPRKTKGFEIISSITEKLKTAGALIDIRLSLYEGIDDGADEFGYKSKLFELLIECGIDIISLSNGFYNIDKRMIYPPKNNTMPIFEEAKFLANTHRGILWNVAGNMEYALIHNSIIPENLSFSLGRQLLSDPQAIIKMKKGEFEDINPCSECNKCHYYSFDLPGIQDCDLSILPQPF